jgi:class 3 adenylate cyclase/tetratricopeptide (TPR) repeat protein
VTASYDGAVICPRCNGENSELAKFCLECGRPLGAARPMREERKVVTVLFADLVGFTSQSERLDPEEVRALLQPYHASVRRHLERFGGTVEKFIGDAVMALFGAPVAHEDDPERAVRAALAVQDALRATGQLHARIGITTGEALVALEARPESGEGMAAGDVVNTSSRLQGAAPVDGILVDETTYRATMRAIEYDEHPAVSLKGKRDPVQVWQAVSARATSGREIRQAGLGPLVGRTQEVEVLAGALARARSQREPQLVTLMGVPGIGKSRIVWEVFQQVDEAQDLIAWRQGRSLPYSDGISYWALGEIVKAECAILDTDVAEKAGEKLARVVEALAESQSDAVWIERHLRPLVGLEPGAELRGDNRGEAFTAWRRFLEVLADQRPLVLVFEDLHWADDGLLDFIDHLVDWATGVPMLIIGTGRPELLSRRPNWGGGKPNAAILSLSPLSDADTSRLVEALTDEVVIADAVRQAVLQRAQGNPLYAEEFARLVAEGGRIDDLPESVQGIIAARLDGLTRPEKELLHDAAVVGKVFWSGAIVSLRTDDRADVEERLHVLERKEFVRRERRSSVADETEYAFRHILVRDVAYGQIPRARRSELHAAAAAWIESLGRPADHAELLAQHYLSAIELARAAGRPVDGYAAQAQAALREAGDRTMALNAFGRAARYYRGALDLLATDDPERPVVLFRYGRALRTGEETGADVLADAEAQLRASGNLELAAEAAVLQTELAWFSGDGEATAAHAARATELVQGLPPSPSKAYVLSGLSRHHMVGGRSQEAIELGERARAIAEQLGLDHILASALVNIGSARGLSGDSAGVADLEAAIAIAHRINSPEATRGMGNLATVLQDGGDIEQASNLWRKALQKAREYGDAAVVRHYEAGMCWILYDEGAWDESLSSADRFIDEAEGRGGHNLETLTRAYRGRIRYARGDIDGAVKDARLAVAAGRRTGNRQHGIASLAFGAWLAVQTGDTAEAHALLDVLLTSGRTDRHTGVELPLAMIALNRPADLQGVIDRMPPSRTRDLFALVRDETFAAAADLADELGLHPQAAILRLSAAQELRRAGREDEALDHIGRARVFWRSVRATHFLERSQDFTGP